MRSFIGTGRVRAMDIRRAIVASLTMLVAAACGAGTSSGGPTVPSESMSGQPTSAATSTPATLLPPGFVAVASGNWWQLWRSVTPDDGLLVGPHSAIQIHQLTRVRTMTAAQARRLGIGNQAVTAGPGHELVLALLSAPDVQPDLVHGDTEGNARASVVVAGHLRKIDNGELGPGTTIVVNAPVGAPVLLRTADAGREQDLDLRTGRRTRTSSPLYYPEAKAAVHPSDLQVGYESSDPAQTNVLTVSSISARLTPYDPKRGWAPPGRAWLWLVLRFAAPLQETSGVTVTARDLGLSVQDAEGAADSTWTSGGGDSLVVDGLAEVPATLRTATLTIHPSPSPPYFVATTPSATWGGSAQVTLTFRGKRPGSD